MVNHDAVAVELAVRRGGVVSLVELDAAGVSRAVRRRLVRQELIREVSRGVYLLGRSEPTWDQQLRVAVARAGPASAVSHVSAAALWELPRVGQGAVEVSLPRAVAPPVPTIGRVHRRRDLSPDDITELGGLPVTTPARTLFDVAVRFTAWHLTTCLEDLARRRLVEVEELQARLEAWRGRGRSGVARLDRLLSGVVAGPEVDSWLEGRFIRVLADHGVAPPQTQVWLDVAEQAYRVDALWPDHRLVVELNGYATHATRSELSADAERAAHLTAAGYTVVVFTYDQVVERPRYVVAQVQRHLAAQAQAVA